MALSGAPIHVSAISGKLAGSVFTKGRSGTFIRRRVKPSNPRTSSQTTVRNQMAAASRGASGLSSANVTQWKNYALAITLHNRVGSAYNPSWITAYNKLAVPFLQMTPAGTPPTTPPATPYTGDTITVTAAGSAGTITYTGSAQQTAGNKTALMYQRLPSANRKPKTRGWKIGSWAAIPATPFQVTVTGLAPGTYAVAYKFGKTATGQETPMVVLANVTVT